MIFRLVLVMTVTLQCLGWVAAVAHDLPDHFPKCHRFDPKLNDCLLNATEVMRPLLVQGIPEFNIPPIDPFKIPQVSLEQGTQALNFKAVLNDIEVRGLANYKFSRFDFDVPNLQFFCECKVDHLDLKGRYDVTGRILVAPIQGGGPFVASIKNSNITVYQKIEIIKKRGQDFVRPVLTNSSIQVGEPRAHIEGLFNGNEEINKATNQIISDNIDVFFQELKPVIEKVITGLIEDLIFKSLEDNVPFDKLYQPIP